MDCSLATVVKSHHNFVIILFSIGIAGVMTNNDAYSEKDKVHIVVLLPYDDEYLFGKNKIEPAIDFAMTSLHREKPPELRHLDFVVTYR